MSSGPKSKVIITTADDSDMSTTEDDILVDKNVPDAGSVVPQKRGQLTKESTSTMHMQ